MKVLLLAALASWCAFAQTTNIAGGRTIQGGVNTFTAAGTANAIVGTMPTGATITAYAAGATYSTVLTATNTGAVTLNIDGVGAKAVKQYDGTTDLVANTLVSGAAASFLYNGTAFQYLGGGGTSSSSPVTIPGTVVSAANPMYLYAYFSTNGGGLLHAYSFDGLNFTVIDPQSTFNVGVRDPSIMQIGSTFYYVSTSGTTGSFQFWTSTDLKTFTTPQTISPAALSSSTVTWAPEWFTDSNGSIYVTISAKVGGVPHVYTVPYTVGVGFGAATQMTLSRLNSSYDLFDAQVKKIGSAYYLFFVEGPSPDHNPSNIVWATSTTFTGTYTQSAGGNQSGIPSLKSSSSVSTPTQAEGPTVFQIGNTSCYRMIGDVFASYNNTFGWNSISNDYHQETTTSCDGWATHTTPTYFPLPSGEQGTVIQITDPTVAQIVINAAAISTTRNFHPGNFGINNANPRYTLEATELAPTGVLQYARPASIAGNSGNNVDGVLSVCGTPGTWTQYCDNPPISNGAWMMLSDTASQNGQFIFGNPSNGFSGLVFMDQPNHMANRTTLNSGHAWWMGQNWDYLYTGSSQSPHLHYFSFWDETANKTPMILRGDTGEGHFNYGFTLGTGTTNTIDNRASFDSPSSGTVNCGSGAFGSRDCTFNAGGLSLLTTGATTNTSFLFANTNASFSAADVIQYQTNYGSIYTGLSGPSNSLANNFYAYDGVNSIFPFRYNMPTKEWTMESLLVLKPVSSDPGCSFDGKVWIDNSDSSNTHMRVCMKRSGTLGWQPIN